MFSRRESRNKEIDMTMKIQILATIFTLLAFSSVGFADSFVYDDFSDNSLDTTKWNITCGTIELGCLPVVDINTTTETFQIEQPTPHGIGLATATYLNLIGHNFTPEEMLEFGVNYSKNIGNQVLGFQYDTLPPAPAFSNLGYWNGVVGNGNLAGLYHFKITFLGNKTIIVVITKPDNTTVNRSYSYSTDDPHFYISAATGHDGILRADYDNFIITTSTNETQPPPCNCTNLTNRVTQLEEHVANLTNRMNELESRVSALETLLDSVQDTINDFIEQIIGFLSNTPKALKKQMICGYMKDSGLTSYEALGLSCTINSKNICKCDNI